ncbi:class I SAM-dependent methyltransferase [Anaeromassilibacillus senegalensis]|uniref:Class I SAM-dependent methyltransferase n=1 Tax=Anaeromassilibacillus senegalensis TaxID=1673717 RepID=A0ABS9MHN4_9FIRM|nr:class I SAM-dependent methyltransferase [Anaeromassilibacillus senegalensis]MCG4610324.1 class I SAM-dependent methyltransferase [Anaeromassilibacillus senegalensis]
MAVVNPELDGGKPFDWGKASADYAKYRDIYPEMFYRQILDAGLCVQGQTVLDLGTGTGVLPRNLYRYGAQFVGIDLSPEQIEQARRLAKQAGMQIDFFACPAESVDFPDHTFDVVTACQCFFYFDAKKLLPNLRRMLRPGGRLAILYMAWLPGEDPIARASEQLVLRYNPSWSGGGETRHPIELPPETEMYFTVEQESLFDLKIPFTRESWNGRMKACRGIGASLSEKEVAAFEEAHMQLLQQIAPEHFFIEHYAAMTVLRVKK